MLPAVDERRWLLPTPLDGDDPAAVGRDAGGELPEELLAILRRRGLLTAAAVRELLDPEAAPEPEAHFPGLTLAVERLVRCCQTAEPVAICGDYDADGMTSTALLVGVLQRLGARPRAAIPSRMDDGYGLNAAMVERLAAEGVRLLITVDNGVAATEALERAAALAVEVILTDHHTLPARLPPHLALLHPAVTPDGSPYRGLAGVGLAHLLATALCRRLKNRQGLEIALNLFCIGTIADMAPLQGVNRRWLLDGLPRLGHSPLPGLQALRQLAGLEKNRVDAEAVGFQLAPRINAVGRLGDPQLVVDLLTTEDPDRALELARSCEALNRQRRELCGAIEAEALALLEADGPRRPAFLLLAQGHWHHGVIGIVASRLVERFGRPVALLAAEGGGRLRASVRSPKGFAVDAALTACADLLERHGGHPAAGGFTVRAENVAALQDRLEGLAGTWLETAGDGRAVEPEALLRLERIDREFWHQLQRLAPFGIGHPTPLFWASRCQVVEQKVLRGGHLQLQLAQGEARLRAIAWRWQGPDQWSGSVDVAFRLRRDDWQGVERFQLELEAIRCSGGDGVVLQRRDRTYWCRRQGDSLVIRNAAGEELRSAIHPDSGTLVASEDPRHPYVQGLLREAAMALGMAEG
ncbi:MAG: single-stranded-DNA-specific exonuclease RecJ [Aphanothece saxicola GSE-SYN-MK-01-06B]|nr:single-stranded-DNA-specific exonuclease RecJ [Aphanothece saxicola GSE-SYN-MK-01-06B]